MKETGSNGHIPTVRSFMVFKTCKTLGLKVDLNTENECNKFLKKQNQTPPKKVIPIEQSLGVFKLCQAFDINAVLASPKDLKDSI
ncbi:hypothetical protein TNCV_3618641 [Trichonephila clavipes]|nr:hypothetical protein TNCV_3618641 [Trichonephila clavipes]